LIAEKLPPLPEKSESHGEKYYKKNHFITRPFEFGVKYNEDNKEKD
jgi:hypothetical protein